MCTVSVVPHGEGVRVMCNRDERPDRAAALPPRVTPLAGGGWTRFAVDPAGGGTWFGVNDRGLVLALLNQSHPAIPDATGPSRGLILPPLLALPDLAAVVGALACLDPAPFRPFRIVALHGREVVVAARAGRGLSVGLSRLEAPQLFTSSSLGDEEADRQRRPWFDRLVVDAHDPLPGQQRFHTQGWTADPRFGVMLAREGARTVSRATIDLDEAGRFVAFGYDALPAAELAA